MLVIQNDAHKNFHNLMKECAKTVFPLSKRDLHILKKIAINNTPPNLLEITDYVKKDKEKSYGIDRSSISRRIFDNKQGTTLQNLEFIRRDHEEHTYRKEKRHYLSLKGILAIHADVHFESIYSLKWYFHFLSSTLCDQKLIMFSTNYIKFQMLFFLFWHKISGLQLLNLKNPLFYYSKFFEVQPDRMFDNLPLSQIPKLERKRFKEIAFLYLSYDKALDMIKSKQKFSNIEINQSSLPLEYQKNFQDVKVKCFSFLFVKKWYEFISNVQIRYYKSQDYKKIPMKYKIEFIDDESINLRDNILVDTERYSERIVKSLI